MKNCHINLAIQLLFAQDNLSNKWIRITGPTCLNGTYTQGGYNEMT